MKRYVISTQYLPLITINRQPSFGKKPMSKRSVSRQDLQEIFEASKGDSLIVCDTKEMAQTIMAFFLKGHNTTSDFIESGIEYFVVPVIFTVELNEGQLLPQEVLKTDDLIQYADTGTIPLYLRSSPFVGVSGQLKRPEEVTLYQLNGLCLDHVMEATYLKADGSSFISQDMTPQCYLNMQILSGFIAALGVAAVAIALVLYRTTNISRWGIVPSIEVSAALLEGVGLFKYAPEVEINSSSEWLTWKNTAA